jgi:hypothetical protein
MRVLLFMEELLTLEAEAKYLLAARDRSYERALKQELLKILEEAEFLFGPRDSGYELRDPLLTECFTASVLVYPFRFARIYLSNDSRNDRQLASYELAHEAIHLLGPAFTVPPTILEEGLATWFSFRYVNRIYGLGWQNTSDAKYDAALRAVAALLAKNEFAIRELRVRQPVISKIDAKLLVEVAGLDLSQAEFLSTDFQSYRKPTTSWSAHVTETAQIFARGARSIWDQWSAETKTE